MRSVRNRQRDKGSALVEFVFVFVIFFVMFYGLVAYALPMALVQGFTLAAGEGARAAVQVDPTAFTGTSAQQDYENKVRQYVRDRTWNALGWFQNFPGASKDGDITVTLTSVAGVDGATLTQVDVQIRYASSNYERIVPVIDMPGFGPVPRLPDTLGGSARVVVGA